MEIELSPEGMEAAEKLLELTGEIVKLGILLHEMADEEVPLISTRLEAFMTAIGSLPVEAVKEEIDWDTEGEA